jgi:hypothetical protein
MESLGFFDTPSATTTLSNNNPAVAPSGPVAQAVAVMDDPEPADSGFSASQTQTLNGWKPAATDPGLSRRNIRWSTVLISLFIAVGLGAGAFWIYQRPDTSTVAVEDVTRQAAVVSSALGSLQPLVAQLDATSQANDSSSAAVLKLNEAARELFTLAGALPESASDTRVLASDAASFALNSSRKMLDTGAFYAALEPALIPPALETDASLVDLTAATQDFSNWRAYMSTVAGALPAGVSSGVSTQLSLLLASLDAVQSEYLDALRAPGRFEAKLILDEISHELDLIRFSLDDAMSGAAVGIQADIDIALEKLAALVG